MTKAGSGFSPNAMRVRQEEPPGPVRKVAVQRNGNTSILSASDGSRRSGQVLGPEPSSQKFCWAGKRPQLTPAAAWRRRQSEWVTQSRADTDSKPAPARIPLAGSARGPPVPPPPDPRVTCSCMSALPEGAGGTEGTQAGAILPHEAAPSSQT